MQSSGRPFSRSPSHTQIRRLTLQTVKRIAATPVRSIAPTSLPIPIHITWLNLHEAVVASATVDEAVTVAVDVEADEDPDAAEQRAKRRSGSQ